MRIRRRIGPAVVLSLAARLRVLEGWCLGAGGSVSGRFHYRDLRLWRIPIASGRAAGQVHV